MVSARGLSGVCGECTGFERVCVGEVTAGSNS